MTPVRGILNPFAGANDNRESVTIRYFATALLSACHAPAERANSLRIFSVSSPKRGAPLLDFRTVPSMRIGHRVVSKEMLPARVISCTMSSARNAS